ncbi:MAG: hypothetical protein WCN95_00895 [bacterium]
MKAATLVAMIAIAATIPATSSLAEARKPDFSTRIQAFMPRNTDDWETGGGIDFQTRFWSSENFGTALCVGFDTWTVKSEYSEESDASGTTTTSIYGNMSMIPIGISALYRNNIAEKVSLVFEAGVRYIFTQSNINAEITTADANGTSYSKDTISTDSTFAGLVGVSVETEMIEGMVLQLGFSYQFDLTRPRETFTGEDLGVTSFNSAMINVGLAWAF